jgi:hypothetical protein
MSDGSSRNASHITETMSSKRLNYNGKELARAYMVGYKVRKILNGRRLKKLQITIKSLQKEYNIMKTETSHIIESFQ